MAAALNAEGIETDFYWIGNKPIGGCIGCYQCAKKQKCVFDTVLFSGLGIPSEAIILATAAGVMLDHLDTGVNVMLMIFRTTCDAKRHGKLDQRIFLNR